MSAIAGLLRLDDATASAKALEPVLAAMHTRGPESRSLWSASRIALGHAALRVTPESLGERQPHANANGTLCLVYDGYLHDREDLRRALRSGGATPREDTDAELILCAYELWSTDCVEKLLGEFALAIWDARLQRLYLARDILGMRPLCHHLAERRLFAFASSPRALFGLTEIPKRLNETRLIDAIGDYGGGALEAADKHSTFYKDVLRLPPAHWMTVDRECRVVTNCYWRATGDPEFRLANDDDYIETLVELVEKGVSNALRGGDRVGAMLSGGMDSGSVVAAAAGQRAASGAPPLPTFSLFSRDLAQCSESRAVRSALKIPHIRAMTLAVEDIASLEPELSARTWALDEPFDYQMIVPRAAYLLAARQGLTAILDGIDGDNLMTGGAFLTRLIRQGQWLTAWREASGLNLFYHGDDPALRQLKTAAFGAYAPPSWVRARRLRQLRHMTRQVLEDSGLRPEVASRLDLKDRLARVMAYHWRRDPRDRGAEMAALMEHGFSTAGLERYDRVAAACGIEARHPLMYRPLVEFAMRLPDRMKARSGWPKYLLRQAMNEQLPHAFVRYGKHHVGWRATNAYLNHMKRNGPLDIHPGSTGSLLDSYMRPEFLLDCAQPRAGTASGSTRCFWIAELLHWLNIEFGDAAISAAETHPPLSGT
jgi:asparagine synthase (glutamine-hydrolysing)